MNKTLQLEVCGLVKRYGNEFTLSDVDLTVGINEIVALLGPSGCGKTTILRSIAGVETPDAGKIMIDDEEVFGPNISKPPEQRNIGMVYQNYAIWPHKTVYENVVFPLKHARNSIPKDQHRNRVTEVLEIMEIGGLQDTPATNLSGGQQQRTALARALVHDPDLLLLDEPLSNLDKELRKSMRNELQRLQEELGVSMLYVTHDQEEAFYLADTVLVMNEGTIIERGDPQNLYRRPKSEFTRQFVGVCNRFQGSIAESEDGSKIVNTNLFDFPLSNADYVLNGVETNSVTCFLRPGDIRIGRFGQEGTGMLELQGVVVGEGLLGDKYEVTVQCNGADTELTVHTETFREFEWGDEIPLLVRPKTIQVYGGEEA